MNEADMHNEATTDGRMHPPHPKLSSEEKASVDPGIQSSMLNMIKSKFDASDEGKGIIRTMKPSTAKNYANPVFLMCFAGQKAGLTTAEGIIADLIAVESQSRAIMLPILGGADESEGTYSLVTATQYLTMLRRVIELFSTDGAPTAMAEVTTVSNDVSRRMKKVERLKHATLSYRPIGELMLQSEKNEGMVPATLTAKMGHSIEERAEVHRKLLAETLQELQVLQSEGRGIDLKDSRLVFNCTFLLSFSLPSQRKSPWQMAMYGTPMSPFTEEGELDIEFLEDSPVYIAKKEIEQEWGLTQLRSKAWAQPWMPFPKQMYELIELYFECLHVTYKAKGIEVEGSVVFPTKFGTARGDTSFKKYEVKGFKQIGLPGSTLMNHRHAITKKCIELGWYPSGQRPDLADSFASTMGTTTKHMFGEIQQRACTLRGAYSRAAAAGGVLKMKAALQEYTKWVFPEKKKTKRKRA